MIKRPQIEISLEASKIIGSALSRGGSKNSIQDEHLLSFDFKFFICHKYNSQITNDKTYTGSHFTTLHNNKKEKRYSQSN